MKERDRDEGLQVPVVVRAVHLGAVVGAFRSRNARLLRGVGAATRSPRHPRLERAGGSRRRRARTRSRRLPALTAVRGITRVAVGPVASRRAAGVFRRSLRPADSSAGHSSAGSPGPIVHGAQPGPIELSRLIDGNVSAPGPSAGRRLVPGDRHLVPGKGTWAETEPTPLTP